MRKELPGRAEEIFLDYGYIYYLHLGYYFINIMTWCDLNLNSLLVE
jgi:hypothetical protein